MYSNNPVPTGHSTATHEISHLPSPDNAKSKSPLLGHEGHWLFTNTRKLPTMGFDPLPTPLAVTFAHMPHGIELSHCPIFRATEAKMRGFDATAGRGLWRVHVPPEVEIP